MRNDLLAVNCVVWRGYAGSGRDGWAAEILWQDNKFAQTGSVEGIIRTRYYENTLAQAVDLVLEVCNQFKLSLYEDFSIFYRGDGEDPNYPPPEGWEKIIAEECKRRGWRSIYETPHDG